MQLLYHTIFLFLLVLFSACFGIQSIASENSLPIRIIRTNAQNQPIIIYEQSVTKKIVEQCLLFKNASEDCTEYTGSFDVNIDHDSQYITVPIIQTFLQLSEDGNISDIPAICTQNTGLMELAERLNVCAGLRNIIASISFTENVYDTLYRVALNKKNFWSRKPNINFSDSSAQKWFVDCIAQASEKQKFIWRKKLYPLQYSSELFVALKTRVVADLKNEVDPDKKPVFNTLPEFIAWQDSFLHRAYCAARPLNAVSSQLFQNTVNSYQWEHNGLDNSPYSKYRLSCMQCKKEIEIDEQKPFYREKRDIGCDYCIKQFLNGKAVDLSDCYNLNNKSLTTLISNNPHKYEHSFVHLPHIHLPLLELLVHYKNVPYRYFMSSYCRLNFGNGAVELDPVDIQGLTLFNMPQYVSGGYRAWMFCSFILSTKNNVSLLKGELSKLRKKENFFIKFIAPDAVIQDSYNPHTDGSWKENYYRSIWVNTWPLGGAFVLVGLYCIYKLISKAAHDLAWSSQDAYNKDLPAYMTQLNSCASQIPTRTQSIAGYLATTKQPINIQLPAEFNAPTFTENPSTITLPDIKLALHAAQKLNQIKCPDQPYSFGFFAGALTSAFIFLNAIIGSWTDFCYLFPFTWPIINACRITVVKPYQVRAKNR